MEVPFSRVFRLVGGLSALLQVVGTATAASDGKELAKTDFFEKHIRPVLVESCYECHSARSEKLRGGLMLDTRDGV